MLNPKAKSILPVVLAIVIAAAGCGGGGDSSTTNEEPTVTGAASAEPKPSTTEKTEDGPKKAEQSKKSQENRKGEKRSGQAAADELTRKLAKSGKPIPADSAVAQELLESLAKSKGGKGKKKSADPVAKALEEVLSEPNEGGGESPAAGEGPSAGVEKILEQIQE